MNSLFDLFSSRLKDHPHRFWPALPGRSNHKSAAVLVPIQRNNSWTCFLTLRSPRLREHRFEISFPGGKPEPQDASLQDTALRECREEIGLQSPRVIGRLSSMPLYTSDYRLEPFVAWVDAAEIPTASPDEVAEVLPIPLLSIFEQPFIHGFPFVWKNKESLSPLFFPRNLSPTIETDRWIFGGTAYVLYELLQILSLTLQRDLPSIRRTHTQFPFNQ